ncbi:sensor histidine kinase [Sphingomonas sp.]|jgi:two-component sensor histidine kinase|uniref:sensor histidine kinase n=1 Tax=Sphingomonas sp. TaxID=28214 RepID=UPI002D806062|nr:histidine kinase dimerization/phosphoacceptor domain -containing protein [Sphingomonas sp.]HEU0044330.1 histidine kinase dimerization/phosphoacceptor domain -containing protein [Sphingomonas sp.]
MASLPSPSTEPIADDGQPGPGRSRVRNKLSWLSRQPTGVKLFIILSLGLLPLVLIAMAATLQTTRIADAEARARLRVSSIETARAIAIELVGDMRALHAAADALGADPLDAPSCARAAGVFAQRTSAGKRFTIVNGRGEVLCGEAIPFAAQETTDSNVVSGTIIPGRGALLAMRTARNRLSVRAFFPTERLAALAEPTSRAMPFSSTLEHDGTSLVLKTIPDVSALDRLETMETDLGIAGLSLRTSIRSAPISSSLIVALLLPLLMWIAAAGISWLVVDRLLIRPLRRLRASVAAFRPGEVIEVGGAGALPAAEIRELGDTFRAISRTVAIHEKGLAEGLVRQTKLTREVHHRVKNNLQVISSLINFHARGAPSADATAAYSSIQRRVDALAVVHRNHFAENEENRGLNLRTMLGELAANIRATAIEGPGQLGITLDVEPLMANQDVAVAVAFLVTETIELAMNCDPAAQVRISIHTGQEQGRAVLRVVSRALIESDALRELTRTRYARVMEGLSRQLRAPLHHEPLGGAYEIAFAIIGRA